MTYRRFSRRYRLLSVLTAAAIGLSGCGNLLDPGLTPDPERAGAYDKDPSLANAVALAQSLRDQYAGKVEDQMVFDNVTKVGLVGLAAAGAGLALTGGGTVPLVAVAASGGALAAGGSLISSKPEQYIYAAGATAVQCALDTMQPMIVASKQRETLVELLNGSKDKTTPALKVQIAAGEQLLGRIPEPAQSPTYLRLKAAVTDARAILVPAQTALITIDNAGGELRSSLARIQLQVTNAIIASTPSIDALARSLGFALPSIGKTLTVAPSQPAETTTIKSSSTLDGDMDKASQELEQRVAELSSIIAAVNEKPSSAKMETCGVDTKQLGLTMSLSPTGELSVAAPTGDIPNILTIHVSGGVLPYNVGWLGKTPSATEVDLSLESGRGDITITVKKGAQDAVYGLQVQDAANGLLTTTVHVVAASPAKVQAQAQPIARGPAPAACSFDAGAQKAQQFLIAHNVTTVTVAGADKTLTADGCYGDITDTAILTYFKTELKLSDDQIPKTPQERLKAILDLI